jgi:hypothetical protein
MTTELTKLDLFEKAEHLLHSRAEQVRAAVVLLHPTLGCLPLPTVEGPRSLSELDDALKATFKALFDENGNRAEGWIRARWACPHLPAMLLTDVYELIYHWYQLMSAAGSGDRDRFQHSLKRLGRNVGEIRERFGREPVQWWLAWHAGATVSDRVRKHRAKADPADRNPFDPDTQQGLRYWWDRGRHHDAMPIVESGRLPRELFQVRFCCKHDLEPLHPTMMRANPTDADFEKYEADYQRFAAMARARIERVQQQPPMASGTDLGDGRYFCAPCWKAGVVDGAHERNQPPCELPASVADPIRSR